jgi:hypothetical protein
MTNHAPRGILADTKVVLRASKEQLPLEQPLSHPRASAGDNYVNAISALASFTKINNYLKKQCPENSALALELILINATK